MHVAYVCHHARPNYEYAWFAAMPVEKVTFITTEAQPDTSPLDSKIAHHQVQYEERGWENRFFASTAKRVFYQGFEQYLEDVDVVVVLEVFSSLSQQFVEYCNRIGKPVVVLVYELIPEHPIYKVPRYRGNTKYVLKHATHFVAVSEAARDHLVQLGATPDKITVTYPGIDHTLFTPDRSARTDQSLVFVGKLEPHKGIDMMLETYERISKDMPELSMAVIGAGSWKPQVEALANRNPRVTYIERIDNAKLPSILNKHGIYILPARETKRFGMRIGAEQFGFSIVEAMGCGLAVITADVGALPEVVTDKNIVFPKGDSTALEAATRELLADPARIQSLGRENETLSRQRYDLTTQAQAFADVLQACAPNTGN